MAAPEVNKPEDVKLKTYIVDFILQSGENMARVALRFPNDVSLVAVASIITASNFPAIQGFNAYIETDPTCDHKDPAKCKDLKFVAIVPALAVLAQIFPMLNQVAGRQVLRSAVPVVAASGEDLAKLTEEARRQFSKKP